MATCTERLRSHTFPFDAIGLNLLYGIFLVTRLLTLTFARLTSANFGRGLVTRVHQRPDCDWPVTTVSTAEHSAEHLDGWGGAHEASYSSGSLGHQPSGCTLSHSASEPGADRDRHFGSTAWEEPLLPAVRRGLSAGEVGGARPAVRPLHARLDALDSGVHGAFQPMLTIGSGSSSDHSTAGVVRGTAGSATASLDGRASWNAWGAADAPPSPGGAPPAAVVGTWNHTADVERATEPCSTRSAAHHAPSQRGSDSRDGPPPAQPHER